LEVKKVRHLACEAGADSERSGTISVIVPCYNVDRYLAQCLDSIINQTHRSLEIICLDDGSTDGSLAILQRYAEQDARIKIIDKINEGYGATCNRGLDEATGEWIAIVEPDDWIGLEMYRRMLDYYHSFDVRTQQGIDIIKTPYWRMWMPDTDEQRKLNCSYRRRVHPDRQPFAVRDAIHLLRHHPSIWSALYRRAFIKSKAIRFKPIPGAGWADNTFSADTFLQTEGIIYLDEPFYYYREETPEKSRDMAVNQTMVPFDRWNDVMDGIERLGIDDPLILQAINRRGFTYLGGILDYLPWDGKVGSAATVMFARMDSDLVLGDPGISPGMKQLFGECRKLPQSVIDKQTGKLPYLGFLIKETLYTLRNNGPRYTLQQVRRTVSR
jgi:glycosyltransferase involved in cell wall biosynthesis